MAVPCREFMESTDKRSHLKLEVLAWVLYPDAFNKPKQPVSRWDVLDSYLTIIESAENQEVAKYLADQLMTLKNINSCALIGLSTNLKRQVFYRH